jgi:hypothetical protein
MRPTRSPLTHTATAALALTVLTGLTGCSGASTTDSATAAASVSAAAAGTTPVGGAGAAGDPCSLLTDAQVAELAADLGPGTARDVGGTTVCVWPNARGVDAVQLMVLPARGTPLRAELEDGIAAFGGYEVVAVDGLGDEAAAAFQQADPSLGVEAGLAALIARSEDTVIQLSTPTVAVAQGSAEFATAKSLVAAALSAA